MVKVTISQDLLNLGARLENSARAGFRDAGERVLGNSRQKLVEVDAVATYELYDSGHVEDNGEQLLIKFASPAKIIEHGRRPNRSVPPLPVFRPILERWASAKGLKIDNYFFLAQKIARDGFPGRFPFAKAVAETEPEVRRAFRDAFQELL